jgi:hypothetical protein
LGTRGAEHNNGSTFIGNRDGEQVELAVYQWAAFLFCSTFGKKMCFKKILFNLKKKFTKIVREKSC